MMYTPPGAKVFHKENKQKSIWPAALEPLSMMMSQGLLEIKASWLVNSLGPKPWPCPKRNQGSEETLGGLRNITISPKGGNNQEMEMGLSENLDPNQYGPL